MKDIKDNNDSTSPSQLLCKKRGRRVAALNMAIFEAGPLQEPFLAR
jgi:hypothetical protein